MPEFSRFSSFRSVLGISTLAVSLTLTACGPSEPTTPGAPPTPVSQPPSVLPSAPAEPALPARTMRLQINLDDSLKQAFGIKQVSDLADCAQTLDDIETELVFPGILPNSAQLNLINSGATVQNQNGQTHVFITHTLAELNDESLGLQYTFNDLPVGTASGKTTFNSSENGAFGFITYTISLNPTTGTTVTLLLAAQSQASALPECPRLAARMTGAILTTTNGSIVTMTASPTPTPSATPTPSLSPGAPTPTPTPTPVPTPTATPYPAPVVSGISATTGSALDTITISGTGFIGAQSVKFSAANAFSFTVDSDTQITARVPVGFSTGVVTVIGSGGSASSTESFTLTAYSGPPRTIHVKQDAPANGDGNSWASAYQRLDMALYIAQPGDQLWVAKGTYTPAQPNGNRAAAFALKANVNVYGGFIGNETSLGSRLPGTHQTILSGDLNGDDNYLDEETADLAENAYHVVAGASGAILDGFTIQGGTANGLPPHDRGAGIFNNPNASPILNQLQIIENRAQFQGGGIYNAEGASPTLNNVSITSNLTVQSGGGIYNARNANPTLNQVTLGYNTSHQGAGMFNFNASPVLNDVTIQANNSSQLGAGMCNRQNANPTLNQVRFIDNEGGLGGGMYNGEGSSPLLNQVTMTGNVAQNGGAMYNYDNAAPQVKVATIKGNTAVFVGGGVYNYKAAGATPRFENVTFVQNGAREGGGMANRSGMSPQLTNVVFYNNTASATGGGLHNYNQSSPTLRHVTLYNNVAPTAPEFYATLNSNPQLASTIIWNSTVEAALKFENNASLTANNSCIRGLANVTHSGLGNLNVDPYFVDATIPSGPDTLWMTADDGLRLAEGSPALNYGVTSNVPATDILGTPRVVPPDMGAYEGAFTKVLQPLVSNDVEEGSGETAETGDTITVHYIGKLADGTVFDDSYARGTPYSFTLGSNTVIQGWEQGIPGMKVGGKRSLIIPPHLGYGGEWRGVITPYSTLYFEVELISIP
ncbi:MAG: FKBP-type peptidyl-prolyl cis-trans isomerase [Candidatus Sericytochromatia bacterium]